MSRYEIILIAVGALIVSGLCAGVIHWKHNSDLLKVERVQHRVELAAKDHEIAQLEENAAKARKASDDYQTQLDALRSAALDTPVRTVRLCHAAASTGAVSPPASAGRHPETGSEGLPQAPGHDIEAGPDVGPALYQLADEADQCAAQRDALIRWVRGNE